MLVLSGKFGAQIGQFRRQVTAWPFDVAAVTTGGMRKPVAVLAVVVAALAAGCSADPGGAERVVFATSRGTFSGAGESPAGTVLDFSNLLRNVSGRTVTLRSVRLLSPRPPAIRAPRFTAYLFTDGVFEGLQGNLPAECPSLFHPVPLTAVRVAPHSYSRWDLVLSLIVPRPGRYRIGTMKISYRTGGRTGWQYFYLNETVVIRPAAADPGLVQPFRCGP